METLSDLVRRAKDERRVRSGRALADLAEKHGFAVDRTTINNLIRGTYKSRPSHSLLRAIAWLAQTDLDTVYAAADMPAPGPPFANELPPDVDLLAPGERHAVITVIRAFLASRDADLGDTAVPAGLQLVEDLGEQEEVAAYEPESTIEEEQEAPTEP